MTTLFNRYSNRWQQLPARDRLALKLLSLFLAVTLFLDPALESAAPG